jgi:lipoyl-dependent peroxiredoxin subunit C
MLTIGDKLPEFNLNACVSLEEGKQFQPITNTTNKGKWQVLFSWPLDFTFVEARNAKILGMSTDSQYSHLAWRNSHPELKNLPFPMLADIKRDLSNALGILHKEAGICLRATFIVDPSGTIRWASANDLPVGRSVPEVLRVLDALQTEKLTPCNWKKGEKTLN